MLTIIIRLFIKNPDDVRNNAVRKKYGVVCGGYGIFLNLVLFAGKYLAGVLSASIAMTADAFNNLSDAGSSLISLIGFKLADSKPDIKHPFGHGRIEYLAGLAVSALIVIMGYELVRDSFGKVLEPEDIAFSVPAVIILVVSIMIKFYMSMYCKRIGQKIDSPALIATSTDSLSDTISTFMVLASTFASKLFGISLDGICGLLVGIFIIFAGVKAAKETIDPLLGCPPDPAFIEEVENIVLGHDGIVGMHDLLVHNYGPGRIMISLHAEVPNDGDINVLHDIIDVTENELAKKLNCHAVIHMDPVAVGDPEVESLKHMVVSVCKEIDGTISIHDFRIVKGPTHKNLIFDMVVPYGLKKSDEEIVNEVKKGVSKMDSSCFCIINVDRDYVGN